MQYKFGRTELEDDARRELLRLYSIARAAGEDNLFKVNESAKYGKQNKDPKQSKLDTLFKLWNAYEHCKKLGTTDAESVVGAIMAP